jgi:YggT family protein
LNQTVGQAFIAFLWILIVAVLARSLMTWFPVSPGNQVVRMLNTVTEPLIGPVRRVLPRTGMFDFSAMVVLVLLYVMMVVVQRATGA